jgi:HAMP domain-containing protein
MKIKYKIFASVLAIILIFVLDSVYTYSAISNINGLEDSVNYNLRVYQDVNNYNLGASTLENGVFLYVHNNKAMGTQLIEDGGSQMSSSREDLASTLKDPGMLSEVDNLPNLQLQVTSAVDNVETAVNGEVDTSSLNQSIDVLNTRVEALNLQTMDIAEQSNTNMAISTGNLRSYESSILLYTYTAIGISIIVSLIISIITASLITNPIKEVMTAAKKISWGDFDTTVEITSKDEMGELADSVNRMSTSLKYMTELLNRETIMSVVPSNENLTAQPIADDEAKIERD